jgi:hypothetical protein
MTITYKNFELEVNENSYDLYQTRPPKQSHLKNTAAEIRCHLGYFSKLPQAISKIIQLDLSTREEKVSLTQFIELYRSLKDEVESAVRV